MSEFEVGYKTFIENSSTQMSGIKGYSYLMNLQNEIDHYTNSINQFQGFKTDISFLKGDVAEFHHSGSFNINAALNSSHYKTYVDRSHDFASADITSNFDLKFGLKYMKNGQDSAKAQSNSYFQRYNEYCHGDRSISFTEFIKQRGIEEGDIMNDPIYSGQIRIIPKDQLQDAIDYLKFKIAKEQLIRPEQVKRYQETLDLLQDKIESPDGIQSNPLSKEEAERLALLAKNGDYDPLVNGLTTEELIQFHHLLKEGIKSGTTAAVISMVLKISPEIYRIINDLISKGYIDEGRFKELGFLALTGAAEGFIRGSISASLTIACKSGLLGPNLKSLNPSIIAAATVICFNAMQDSYLISIGKLSKRQFVNNLSRNIFVSSCSLGFGTLLQSIIPMPVLGYLLGNFVGSFIGSFAYDATSSAIISYCIESGCTFLGLVEQDYQLPQEALEEIGISVFDYDNYEYLQLETKEFALNEFLPQTLIPDSGLSITFLRRGVVGVRQIGYL